MTLDEVHVHHPDARETDDGAITFRCPVCELEERHEDFTIFPTGATSCRWASRAGQDYNRNHCRPTRKTLGLTFDAPSGYIVETLFKEERALDLMCDSNNGARAVTVALNGSADELYRDEINLNRADHRSSFARSLPYEDGDDREEIVKALLRLAARRDSTLKATLDEESGKTAESVLFKELPDGRLIEQLHGGHFAVYDGEAADYVSSVECEGVTYRPIADDPCIEDNDLHLPERLTDYGEERLLDEEIETYLATFCDAPARELKFAARLIRLTYIQDRLIEVPYLHIIGPSGSGKTRMSDVVGMACHLPYLIVEGSAASTFRISDKYGVTMCFDEFNPQVDSEDQQALIQILNAGFQRRRKVPRVEKGPNGEFVTRSFRPFGIKIFSGLKLTGSYAFQRRTIPIQLSVTKNPKIPYCDDGTIDILSAPLREKLTLWRLRNLKTDYRSLIRKTEAIFKSKEILPGFVQIGVPLAMLISDEVLRDEFISTMETRTTDAAEDRRESFDGRIVAIVHGRMFDIDKDGKVQWRVKGDLPELEEGKPCEALRVELLAECMNEGVVSERKKVDPRNFGKTIRGVGFKTKEIKSRESVFRGKSAIVYDPPAFARVFNSFSLLIPADFNPPNPPSTDKPKQDNEIQVGGSDFEEPVSETQSTQPNSLQEQDLDKVGGLGGSNSQEYSEEEILEGSGGEIEDVLAEVAVDTETNPFTKKYGDAKTWTKLKKTGETPVTPRTAEMIGLAISYDGAEKTDYITDPKAWPMMMSGLDRPVVFHNSKFDLLKLKMAGLPTPEKWEDTLIAAHLIDEIGAHGLKYLAKKRLGIEEPVTFEEADRMRLIDPPVFAEYAKNDARYTLQLWRKFKPELERQKLTVVYEIEKAAVPAVISMEDVGMKIDVTQMDEMDKAVRVELDRIENYIYETVGKRFDLHSPAGVGAILYDFLGLTCGKKTGKGQRSVDKEALKNIQSSHPAVEAILEYREIDKLSSSFLNSLPVFADESGRIHPEFKPLGSTSGRFSCASPNVQQIPKRTELGKKLRRMFVADEGNALVVADWSQMEPRIIAQYSKDPLLLSAYRPGAETDLYIFTASRMFCKEKADVSKSERDIAKMITLGISYGITPVGLFNRLRPQGVDVTLEQCEQFIADYFKAYSGVKEFLERVRPRLWEKGYVRNWFGRRRRVAGVTPRQVRQAQNFIIQSTAADMAKIAMARLHD